MSKEDLQHEGLIKIKEDFEKLLDLFKNRFTSIENLATWRNITESNTKQREKHLLQLLMLVNATSGGLKSTG